MDIMGVNNISTSSVRNTVEVQRVSVDNTVVSSSVLKNEINYNEKDIKKAVDKFNKIAEDEGIYAQHEERAEYTFHDKFNQLMIKIIDKNTNEILLEVPPKKILDMVAKMCEMVGILVDKKA